MRLAAHLFYSYCRWLCLRVHSCNFFLIPPFFMCARKPGHATGRVCALSVLLLLLLLVFSSHVCRHVQTQSCRIMSLLNSSLQTVVVRLRDMSGNVTMQKLHNRVFDAYEAKALVFEVISPAQQQVMQQHGGVIPPQHPVGYPIVVDSWTELMGLHSDNNLYQLLPRRARSNASYSVLQGICSSAGSPFRMEHREDPVDYKFVFRAADFDVRNQFNATHQSKVPPNIWFDGILKAPQQSALVSFSNSLSMANVNNLSGSFEFLKEWALQPADGDRHRQIKELYTELLQKPTHLFLGTNSAPGRELLNYAKSRNIFVYGKKGYHYVYCA